MTLQGHVEKGTIVFETPLMLPDSAAVEVQVIAVAPDQVATATSAATSLLERMKDFAGTFEGLPPDASVNLDHDLYGSTKRQ